VRMTGQFFPLRTKIDLFACVKLVLPDSLTDQEVDSIRALVSARQKLY